MRRLLALTFMLIQLFRVPVVTAARRAVSVGAASETVNQGASNPALPLGSPDTNDSLSLVANFTPSVQFHIPDSPIDLDITFHGRQLTLWAVVDVVELALDAVAPNVDLRPTEAIPDDFFQKSPSGLEIGVYRYPRREITWYLLERLILGINYYISQRVRPVELRFEIDVMGRGRVGYGSLWHSNHVDGTDVAKRAVAPDPPQQLSIASSISKPALTESNHSSISPTLNDSHIIFSYYLFGPPVPEPAITLCFSRARQSIRANLQRDPDESIPDNSFEYSLDRIPLVINVTAYPGKQISWLLLDHVLREVSVDIIGEHHLRGCEFEFEIDPFLEPHGHGYLEYSP